MKKITVCPQCKEFPATVSLGFGCPRICDGCAQIERNQDQSIALRYIRSDIYNGC